MCKFKLKKENFTSEILSYLSRSDAIFFKWTKVTLIVSKHLNSAEFTATFHSLKSTLKKYENSLRVIVDKNDNYSLNAGYDEKHKTDIYFGTVQIKKNYVSSHLMLVYVNPKLLEGISPELKKRMHGKSCFNFKIMDKSLLADLSELKKKSFEFYKKNKML